MLLEKTHQTVKNILRRLESYQTDGFGSECNFLKIGRIGYKIYWGEECRDFAYKAQQAGYKIGIAPKPYKKFEFIRAIDNEDVKLYCYTTELAKVNRRWTKSKERFSEIEKIFNVDDTDYYYVDNHIGNIGILNGKSVIIDWGPAGARKCLK